jgi:hypothetical protein
MDFEGADFGGGIGGAAGGLIGSLIGELLAAGNYEEVKRLQALALKQYGSIDADTMEKVAAEQMGPSAMEGATGNTEAKQRRMEALRMLSQRGAEGYNAEDRAAINDTLSEVQQAERGSREALMRRVDPNSGAALALQAGNQQAAAQRAHSQGLQIAAGSRAQALRALAETGRLAGGIDESEFGQQSARAGATDAISRFNASNRYDASKFNAGQRQQQFSNQMAKAGAMAGQYQQQAGTQEEEAERKRRAAKGIGQAVGAIGGAAAGAF